MNDHTPSINDGLARHDYGIFQQCPSCSGALSVAERRMHLELAAAKECRLDAKALATMAETERKRGLNDDPQHIHVRGRPTVDADCTLEWHREEAGRARTAAENAVKAARKHERNALRAARDIAAAGKRLLAGCDLCGRGPLPANGRVAA